MRTVLPPLIESDRAPGASLLAQAAFLRQPSTGTDRFNLKAFDRWPDEVIAVFVRYIRVVSGPANTQVAVVPSVICAWTQGRPPGRSTYPEPSPHQILLMQVLSTPREVPPPTIDLGTAADIPRGWANGYIDNPLPVGRSGLIVSVVPSGVARIVLRFPGHHPAVVSMSISENIGIANPVPQFLPSIIKWYAANGRLIRTFHPPYHIG